MKSKFIFPALLPLLFSSCATILLPKNQTVSFNTGSDSASVFLEDDSIAMGREITTRVKRGITTNVTVTCPGHKPYHDVLMPNHRSTAFWLVLPLNTPTAFIGYLYDFTFDKNVSFPSEHNYDLGACKLEFRDTATEKYLLPGSITYLGPELSENLHLISTKYPRYPEDLEIKLREGKARYDEYLNSTNRQEFQLKQMKNHRGFKYFNQVKNLTYMSNYVEYAIGKTGFEPDPTNVFRDDMNTYRLSGRIDRIECYDIKGKRWPHYMMKTRLEMTWFVHDHYNEPVDSFTSSGWSGNFAFENRFRINNPVYECFQDAAYANYLDLLRSTDFRDRMIKDTLSEYVLSPLTLQTPKKPIKKRIEAVKAAITVITKHGHGSGFAITEDGYLITNYHVVASTSTDSFSGIEVMDNSGKKMPARVIRFDKQHDLALLKVDHTFEYAFAFNDTLDDVTLSTVYTIGTPSSVELVQSISVGTASGYIDNHGIRLMQLSMSVNPGNSGGPVFGDDMKLSGVLVSKLIGEGVQGICFAIPVENIPAFLNLSYTP